MDYAESVRSLADGWPQLANELGSVTSLEKLLGWLQQREITLDRIELVAQDEFSHDLMIPLPYGQWLAFGVT